MATIHLDAETHLPDKKPDHTRFVLISDTHTHTFNVPDGDYLLHCGDLTERGSVKELKITVDWLTSLPHKRKVIIAGNHDYCLDDETLKENFSKGHDEYLLAEAVVKSKAATGSGLVYLKDELLELPTVASSSASSAKDEEGRRVWRIWGSPWSAAFFSMAFNAERGEFSEELYSHIPDETDILLTHGPPRGLFDKLIRNNDRVGCDALLAQLRTGLPRLRMHIWGHIHEDRGVFVDEFGEYSLHHLEGQDGKGKINMKRTGTVFVNAANAGTWERPRVWGTGEYQPIVVDLPNELATVLPGSESTTKDKTGRL